MIAAIREFLAAPRRLRELGQDFESLRMAYRAARLLAKREIAQAKQEAEHYRGRLSWYQDQTSRIRELEEEIERLRAENGKHYRMYVQAQANYDRLRGRTVGRELQ